jgi:hypothetical protein
MQKKWQTLPKLTVINKSQWEPRYHVCAVTIPIWRRARRSWVPQVRAN